MTCPVQALGSMESESERMNWCILNGEMCSSVVQAQKINSGESEQVGVFDLLSEFWREISVSAHRD